MKKLSFYGTMLVIALLLGITLTMVLPKEAKAITPCVYSYPYKVLVGDCSFKCQPDYQGYKWAVYAGYSSYYDPITHTYVNMPCNFQYYYCECIPYDPHNTPVPQF